MVFNKLTLPTNITTKNIIYFYSLKQKFYQQKLLEGDCYESKNQPK